LLVAFSPDLKARGAMIPLSGDELTVCRGATDVDRLVFSDAHVSRRHARVRRLGDDWEVTDLASHNGTFVNGLPVGTATLSDGDVLRCGGMIFVLRQVSGNTRIVTDGGSALLGKSFAMGAVREELNRAAAHDAPVLIDGESGVGKELAAQHIASHSKHRNKKFVAVNCASLSRELCESELFGHRAGAFTGAQHARPGLFVSADGGTLFLDEIGEMSLEMQAKLLRALSTKSIRAVGSDQPRDVDARVVAATNRFLPDEVEAGRFRGDLYARIAAWSITIPPLRERREDIMMLAYHFAAAERAGVDFTPDAAETLVLEGWRYNVRALQNAVSVATARAGEGAVDVKHLPAGIQPLPRERGAPSPSAAPSLDAADEPDRWTLEALLTEQCGNVRKAAEALGRDRRQIYRLLEKHGIDADAFRRPPKKELLTSLEQHRGSIARAAADFDTNRRQIYRWLDEYELDIQAIRDGAAREP
jgi:DNA-binding NtrC family response regulator